MNDVLELPVRRTVMVAELMPDGTWSAVVLRETTGRIGIDFKREMSANGPLLSAARQLNHTVTLTADLQSHKPWTIYTNADGARPPQQIESALHQIIDAGPQVDHG